MESVGSPKSPLCETPFLKSLRCNKIRLSAMGIIKSMGYVTVPHQAISFNITCWIEGRGEKKKQGK